MSKHPSVCFLPSPFLQTAMNLLYLALIGHGLSLISLFISLGIFFHFKWVLKSLKSSRRADCTFWSPSDVLLMFIATVFIPYRSLSCQRITLHKNLFFSFVLNSIITIIWLTAVANNQELVQLNPVRTHRPNGFSQSTSKFDLGFASLEMCWHALFWKFFPFQTSCKVSVFIHLYLFGCNYFWMLCEGIYLHTLIVVAVFAEKQHLMWYYLLGWGRF